MTGILASLIALAVMGGGLWQSWIWLDNVPTNQPSVDFWREYNRQENMVWLFFVATAIASCFLAMTVALWAGGQ